MNQATGAVLWLAIVGFLIPAQSLAQSASDTEPAQAAQASGQRATRVIWQLGSGISFSNGDYGQSRSTDVVAIPFNLRARRGDWFARASLSRVWIRGAASIVDTGLDGETETDASGAPNGPIRQTRSGMGDLSLTAGRRLAISDSLSLTSDVRVKFPTASEAQRLTTGTTDVTLRTRLAQEIGNVTLRAGGRRRLAGGGGRVTVRDTWGYFGGASLNLGHGLVAGADYNWVQSSFAGNGPNRNAMAFVSVPVNRRIRITGYGAAGLSINSADIAMGTSVSLRLD